jgi:alpha-glucosidase
MIRPLAFLSQKEKQTLFRMEEFGFGDSLLVCPIARPGITSRKMYLPEGNWFNYWDGKSVKGGHEIIAHAGLDTFPLYVRSGAVIPHFPVINTTASKPDEIIFNIYFSFHRRTSFHYIDQYEGYGYKNEMYLLEKFTIFGNRRQMRILKSYEGGMQNPFKKYTIKIFGLPFVPSGYEIDHVLVKLPSRYKNKSLTIEVTTAFNKIRIIY